MTTYKRGNIENEKYFKSGTGKVSPPAKILPPFQFGYKWPHFYISFVYCPVSIVILFSVHVQYFLRKWKRKQSSLLLNFPLCMDSFFRQHCLCARLCYIVYDWTVPLLGWKEKIKILKPPPLPCEDPGCQDRPPFVRWYKRPGGDFCSKSAHQQHSCGGDFRF